VIGKIVAITAKTMLPQNPSPAALSGATMDQLKHERRPLEKQTLQTAGPTKRKMSSLERWLTVFVIIGAALVYLAVYLQSAIVFVVGEGVCLLVAPIQLWLERDQIRKWWNSRGKCPECGYDLRRVKGDCPGCGHKRITL
jgi:hypothetical protein